MTMLDRMRRHKSWLKWSLASSWWRSSSCTCPQFLDPTGTAPAPRPMSVATVDGRRITADDVPARVPAADGSSCAPATARLTDDMIRQLGFGQRMVQQLVSQEAQLAEAERLGITVTDGELRERLVRLPSFQENGVFIGEARYRSCSTARGRPPARPSSKKICASRSSPRSSRPRSPAGCASRTPTSSRNTAAETRR